MANGFDYLEEFLVQDTGPDSDQVATKKASALFSGWPPLRDEPCSEVQRASLPEVTEVLKGVALKEEFLSACIERTNRMDFCQQVIRPNPASASIFRCTYPPGVPPVFIPVERGKWIYAFRAIEWMDEMEAQGIALSHIYNWLRPEPYNKNVSGDPNRHPFGTAIDLRLATKGDQQKAFTYLCEKWRAHQIHAIGYYGSASLHLGMGDPLEWTSALWIESPRSVTSLLWITDPNRVHSNSELCHGIDSNP